MRLSNPGLRPAGVSQPPQFGGTTPKKGKVSLPVVGTLAALLGLGTMPTLMNAQTGRDVFDPRSQSNSTIVLPPRVKFPTERCVRTQGKTICNLEGALEEDDSVAQSDSSNNRSNSTQQSGSRKRKTIEFPPSVDPPVSNTAENDAIMEHLKQPAENYNDLFGGPFEEMIPSGQKRVDQELYCAENSWEC